jgi:hypothetical protein
MITAKELFELAAEPVDITAAKLLWKSPWWAKALESIQDLPVNETTFLRTLGTLYRNCQKNQNNKVGMQEFCDLASMARKIRWKFPTDRPGFDDKYLARLKRKLSNLEWNQEICRFEFNPSGLRLPHWNTLSQSQKNHRRQKQRKLRKNPNFKEQRKAARAQREIKVRNLIAQALKDDVTPCTTSNA